MGYGVRVQRKRKPNAQIDFSAISSLTPEILKSLECVFLVDLTSFASKSCNKLIHQMLFGKVKAELHDKVRIYVIMKTKFSPKCKECNIGEKNSSLFLKDRFVKAGDGRVILQLTSSEGSLKYRKQLSKYIYDLNQNLVILSEDKQYGFKIIGSDVPDDDEDSKGFLNYFEFTDLFGSQNESSISADLEREDLERVKLKVEKWVGKRLEKEEDIINLPKTMQALENSLTTFTKSSLSFPFKSIIKILRDAGDITVCETCQTCKPVSTNTSNQFYFSYKTLTEEVSKQCTWLMHHIITEYTKNSDNQIPLEFSHLFKSNAPKRFITHSPEKVIDHLMNDCKLLKISDKSEEIQEKPSISLLDDNSHLDEYSGYYSSSLPTTPTKSTYKTPSKSRATSTHSTPIKSPFKKTGTPKPPISSLTSSFFSTTKSYKKDDFSDPITWIPKVEKLQF